MSGISKKLMSIKTVVMLSVFALALPCYGGVLFETNFDNIPDFNISSANCGSWSGGLNQCTSAPSGFSNYYTPSGGAISSIPGGLADHTGASAKKAWISYYPNAVYSGGSQINKTLPQDYPELYMRVWIRSSPGWYQSTGPNQNEYASNVKVFRMLHFDRKGDAYVYFSGGNSAPIAALNWGASDAYTWQANHSLYFPVYRGDPQATFYQSIPGTFYDPVSGANRPRTGDYPYKLTEPAPNSPGGMADGQWHRWDLRVKMNSSTSAADGIYQLWYDGVLVRDDQNVQWCASGSDGISGWNSVELGGNGDNSGGASFSQQWLAFDDLVVSTTPIPDNYAIGGSVAADTTAPTAFITYPASNASVSGTLSVNATAADNVGVSRIELYVNNVLKSSDTTTPYLLPWDTRTVTNGSYSLVVKAYDAAGNVGQSSAVNVTVNNTLAVDTTAPTAAINTPVNNATVSGTVGVSASASDNVAVSKVEIYHSGSIAAVINASPYSYNCDTRQFPNGSHSFVAKAYDSAGNVGQSAAVLVNVNNPVPDTSVPVVSISSPAAGSAVSGTATVSANASDNVGVAKVEFYVDGSLKATDTASPYSFGWNSTTVANGSHALTVKGYDAAGNIGQSGTVTVTVSNTVAPVPFAGSIWSNTAIPSVVDSGPDNSVELGVKFRSDVSGYITGIRFYKASTNTGTHVGNLWSSTGTRLATATFTNETASGWQSVNFSSPVAIAANTVYVASYHTNTGHYSFDSKYFSGKGADNPPLHALADGVSGYSGAFAYGSTSAFPNQGYNSSNYWVDVIYSANVTTTDTTVPVVSIVSPASNATVSGSVTVTASATDNVGVARVEFYLDGALKASATAAPYSFVLNTTTLSNGSHSLSSKAYDAAGNVGQSAAYTVNVSNVVADTLAPSVSLSTPAGTVSGSVSIAATASDNTGVSRVEFYINGVLMSTDTAAPYAFAWNSSSVVNGSYALSAKAFDAAGNAGQSATVQVAVQNTVADAIAPVVTISAPTASSFSISRVRVTASATDNVAVSRMELYIDGVLKGSATGSSLSKVWYTSGYAKGNHVIMIKSYDAAGNVGTRSKTVTKL